CRFYYGALFLNRTTGQSNETLFTRHTVNQFVLRASGHASPPIKKKKPLKNRWYTPQKKASHLKVKI
ncbi:hypothetical protein ACQWFX_24755, partial [Salmonella enterica subsp. enterica serovar Infantis]